MPTPAVILAASICLTAFAGEVLVSGESLSSRVGDLTSEMLRRAPPRPRLPQGRVGALNFDGALKGAGVTMSDGVAWRVYK